MKKFLLFLLLFCVGISTFLFLKIISNNKTDDVYKKCINSIVEVKSSTNDYGESYGTFRTKESSGKINYGFVYAIPISIVKNYIELYNN